MPDTDPGTPHRNVLVGNYCEQLVFRTIGRLCTNGTHAVLCTKRTPQKPPTLQAAEAAGLAEDAHLPLDQLPRLVSTHADATHEHSRMSTHRKTLPTHSGRRGCGAGRGRRPPSRPAAAARAAGALWLRRSSSGGVGRSESGGRGIGWVRWDAGCSVCVVVVVGRVVEWSVGRVVVGRVVGWSVGRVVGCARAMFGV